MQNVNNFNLHVMLKDPLRCFLKMAVMQISSVVDDKFHCWAHAWMGLSHGRVGSAVDRGITR